MSKAVTAFNQFLDSLSKRSLRTLVGLLAAAVIAGASAWGNSVLNRMDSLGVKIEGVTLAIVQNDKDIAAHAIKISASEKRLDKNEDNVDRISRNQAIGMETLAKVTAILQERQGR